ncbi:MAG: cadherin-like beta sandwich domain-containing protein, partial [Treponema sp.]|nr:cadherin-like beta sandwich domain-containing protein [Treponema sp.]
IATGTSVPVDLAADATQTVPVGLSFSQSPTSGAFSLPIQWPLSTGLAYVSASLDGAAMTDPTVNSDTTNYSATVAKSGLAGGSHTLRLSFKTSSVATAVRGQYVETVNIWDGVTSASWLDSSGACAVKRTFALTDFFDTNANLGGLLVQDGSTAGAEIPIGFSSSTTAYSLYAAPSTGSIVFTPTTSIPGQYISYSWTGGATSSGEQASGTSSSALSFSPTVADILTITVRAPDGTTSKTYTITWYSSATVSIGVTAPSYQGLSFPISTPIIQGQAFWAETDNPVLDAITSGWTWYIDGVSQSQTSQRFVLSPTDTTTMLGTYLIAATVTSGGVSYSGRLSLTVTRMADLGINPASAVVKTLAGSGTVGSADGIGIYASFNFPGGVTTDGTNLYVADCNNGLIRKIVLATKAVTTIPVSTVAYGIATDGTNLYVADIPKNEILKIVIATGAMTVLAGSTTPGSADDIGTAASFTNPYGLATDGTNLYVADFANNEIRKVVIATGKVTTLAGSTTSGYVNDIGTAARFNNPIGITTDGTNLYVTDYANHAIRKVVIATGTVTTFAGTGAVGSADGTGTAASFNYPYGITTDGTNLYVADHFNHEIRKIVIATAAVTTLAGTTTSGYLDGIGTAARFNCPSGIATDGTNLYIGEPSNNVIRKIQP